MQGLHLEKVYLEQQWTLLRERLGNAQQHLLVELEAGWREQQATLDAQRQWLESLIPSVIARPDLLSYQQERAEFRRQLFDDTLAQWERRRPYKRALAALDNYDRNLIDLIRLMPEQVSTSGSSAAELLQEFVPGGWTRRLARWRHKEREIAWRAIVHDALQRLIPTRLQLEGEYLRALALSLRQLRLNWELLRAQLDTATTGEPLTAAAIETQWNDLRNAIGVFTKQVTKSLVQWREWPVRSEQMIAQRILAGIVRRRKTSTDNNHQRNESLAHAARQLQSVETELRLEQALLRCEDQSLTLLQKTLNDLRQERNALASELDEVIAWLRDSQNVREFPPPQTDVVPVPSRLQELDAALQRVLAQLPIESEILPKLTVTAPRRVKWRKLQPRATFRQAFAHSGRPALLQTAEECGAEHRQIIQEIERAREVVSFSQETATAEADAQIAKEARQNALALLEYTRSQLRDRHPALNTRITAAQARVFNENRQALQRDRLGAFAFLARHGFRRALTLGVQNTAAWLAEARARLSAGLKHGVQVFQISIGWKPDPSTEDSGIVTRAVLPAEFTVDLNAKELPAIYRRLFRSEPVEDPRFLVGRAEKIAAIATARNFWEAGRPASIMVVGHRGSGKTSLLNCAVKNALDGLEVLRGEFHGRITNETQLTEFLAQLVGVEDAQQLEKFLLERRRVIILEELERIFLRQIGHFNAVRALQRLITSTCATTLWIVATNQVAFNFLDAATALGQSFSHRLNATTAARDDLRQAIMLRHNLTGLRLQFDAPPPPASYRERLWQRLHKERDAEALFFDVLAKESGGVFRAAFEIWLGQIDRVQAGALYLKPLVTADLSALVKAMDLDDLFTLMAVLQHGSLTPEEHATIFQKSLTASRSQMDELLAREIIEPDPGRPGLRVRPEAMRLVNEALYRRNLL